VVDSIATPQAEILQKADDGLERFCRSGIRPNFKCSLAKILWLRDQQSILLHESTWLLAADTVAYHLTGVMATTTLSQGVPMHFALIRNPGTPHGYVH